MNQTFIINNLTNSIDLMGLTKGVSKHFGFKATTLLFRGNTELSFN